MNNKMEPVTPVVILQGAMVFALLAGFAFGLFTGQAHVAGLAMAWLSLCGWFFTIAPVIVVNPAKIVVLLLVAAVFADPFLVSWGVISGVTTCSSDCAVAVVMAAGAAPAASAIASSSMMISRLRLPVM